MSMQTEQAVDLVSELVKQAPVAGAFALLVGGFLWYLRDERRQNRVREAEREQRTEARHQTYFAHLDSIGENTAETMKETNTMLGRVAETNREVVQALHDFRASPRG